MKRNNIILTVLAAILLTFSAESHAAKAFNNETLHYVISYKWGLIHKDAGDATLTLRRNGNKYSVMLAAKTKPWADKIFMVRDTLLANISVNELKPLSYQKITHEKDKYARDVINYKTTGNQTTGICKRYREKDGKINVSEKTLTAGGPVYDMLSVFYYLRQLNYDALTKNMVYKATVFSGNKKETIRIRNIGKETITMRNKTKREAYHIKFNFTQDGGKKSSDDIDTWISTDSSHVPLYLVGGLPLGQVRAYLL